MAENIRSSLYTSSSQPRFVASHQWEPFGQRGVEEKENSSEKPSDTPRVLVVLLLVPSMLSMLWVFDLGGTGGGGGEGRITGRDIGREDEPTGGCLLEDIGFQLHESFLLLVGGVFCSCCCSVATDEGGEATCWFGPRL